jgi:uncharacterized membrane protein (UPF0136 family)
MTDSNDGRSRAHRTWPLAQLLEDLEQRESGLGFVYAALDLLAKRYGLKDVVVVLANESYGTQMFRLGGKAVTANIAARIDAPPGVYCDPDVVPESERDAVHVACDLAYSRHLLEFKASRDAERRNPPRAVFDEIHKGEAVQDRPVRRSLFNVATHVNSYRSLARYLRRQESRVLVSQAALFTDCLVFLLTVSDVHGPIRFVAGLVLGLFIPGWSVVGRLKLRNAALELGLAIAVSVAILMVVAQLLITWHEWHPVTLEELTCLVCLPSLISQSNIDLRPMGAR